MNYVPRNSFSAIVLGNEIQAEIFHRNDNFALVINPDFFMIRAILNNLFHG
jgi:hypothetical protein